MEDAFIVMWRTPKEGFPRSHLLVNIVKGKPYVGLEKYARSVAIIDELGTKVWVSGKVFKKHFKNAKRTEGK